MEADLEIAARRGPAYPAPDRLPMLKALLTGATRSIPSIWHAARRAADSPTDSLVGPSRRRPQERRAPSRGGAGGVAPGGACRLSKVRDGQGPRKGEGSDHCAGAWGTAGPVSFGEMGSLRLANRTGRHAQHSALGQRRRRTTPGGCTQKRLCRRHFLHACRSPHASDAKHASHAAAQTPTKTGRHKAPWGAATSALQTGRSQRLSRGLTRSLAATRTQTCDVRFA